MQQAVYNKIIGEIAFTRNVAAPKAATQTTDFGKRLARRIAHQWDLWGIVTLLGSCGVYAVFAIAHVG